MSQTVKYDEISVWIVTQQHTPFSFYFQTPPNYMKEHCNAYQTAIVIETI